MKAPLLKINHLTINYLGAEAPVACTSFMEPGTFTPAAPAPPAGDLLTPPAIGEIWPGQGGIYAGVRNYPEGLRHVVFAAEDVGRHAWARDFEESGAVSRIDGRKNTEASIDAPYQTPAAEAACNYTADGHQDFYLPSIGELSHAWLYIPESFAKVAHWSSSQRSANCAFLMGFDDGYQGYGDKGDELHVRPVRSLPIR